MLFCPASTEQQRLLAALLDVAAFQAVRWLSDGRRECVRGSVQVGGVAMCDVGACFVLTAVYLGIYSGEVLRRFIVRLNDRR